MLNSAININNSNSNVALVHSSEVTLNDPMFSKSDFYFSSAIDERVDFKVTNEFEVFVTSNEVTREVVKSAKVEVINITPVISTKYGFDKMTSNEVIRWT